MIKKLLLLFILILIFVFLAGYQISMPFSFDKKIFIVEHGDNLFDISSNLENQGFIRDELFFNIYVYLIGKEGALKAGDYLLTSPMSTRQIADKIIKGDADGLRITIIEGWNNKQIAGYLSELNICSKEEFLEKSKQYEGYLFPDTYRITSAMTAERIIEMMRNNFDKKTKALEKDIQEETVIMASIIEKEVITLKDKKLVSGILWKRIRTGMPLQSCATISYITGKKTTKVSIEETQIDSLYNTYKYAGLPVGPICNPGLESIEAALYPEESEYWYHLSTPEGQIIFSRTFEEHNIAKAKYLK